MEKLAKNQQCANVLVMYKTRAFLRGGFLYVIGNIPHFPVNRPYITVNKYRKKEDRSLVLLIFMPGEPEKGKE